MALDEATNPYTTSVDVPVHSTPGSSRTSESTATTVPPSSCNPGELFAYGLAFHGSRATLPVGYRQGIITAITVFIGFSLAFLRFWAFEASGQWTTRPFVELVILLIPIFGLLYGLYRALLVEHHDEVTYKFTIKWFVWSVLACCWPFAWRQ